MAGTDVAFSNEQHRKRYAEDSKHRERKLASNRAYRATHQERLNALWRDNWQSSAACRERHAGTRRKTIYGLSAEHHRRLVEQQNGVCAICKRPSRRALCVDHCHATRVVRGLLCDKCNTALGLLGDDAGRVLAAVAYSRPHPRHSRNVYCGLAGAARQLARRDAAAPARSDYFRRLGSS